MRLLSRNTSVCEHVKIIQMKYSSVIFDWDGTLGKTLHLWLEAYRNELKNLGHIYPDEVIVRDFFNEHDRTALKYPQLDFPIFLQKVHDNMNNHVSNLGLYSNSREVLEILKENGVIL